MPTTTRTTTHKPLSRTMFQTAAALPQWAVHQAGVTCRSKQKKTKKKTVRSKVEIERGTAITESRPLQWKQWTPPWLITSTVTERIITQR